MDIMGEYSDNAIFDIVMRAMPSAASFAKGADPTQLGPLVLAYIGDTIFDLYVRTRLVCQTSLTAHGLHMAAAKQVCAAAQAQAYYRIAPTLTEEEQAVFKRGRNAHMGTIPKNASIADYRAATGVEAVAGWLYLKGRDERLNEIMRAMVST